MFQTKRIQKKYTHSSYQLNTVFTDVYLFTPTELHGSSCCNITTSCYSYGTTLLCNLFSKEGKGEGLTAAQDQSNTQPDQLHGRMEANGQQVCLRLGLYWRDGEANHTVYFTSDSPVQQFCCICISFFLNSWMKAKLPIPPKLTAEYEVEDYNNVQSIY